MTLSLRFKRMLLLVVILGTGLFLFSRPTSTPAYSQTQTITVTNPSGSTSLYEARDYATLVWNNPWDMSDDLDIRQLDSPQCTGIPNHFTVIDDPNICPDGLWCGQVRPDISNPDFFVLHPGYDAINTNRIGPERPVQADYYTQLTFRMYISEVGYNDPGWQVTWTDGAVGDIGGDSSRYGASHLFKAYSGWHIYTINLANYRAATPPDSQGKLPWTGQITGLRLDPGLVDMNNKIVKLDWIRLTPAYNQRVEWETNQYGTVAFKFQNGTDVDELHMYDIQSYGNTEWTTPRTIYSGNNYYDIPASLPPGDWYVIVAVNGQPSNPAGPWQIRALPTVKILQPGYTTGQEYATSEKGDPWDMSNAEDVYSYGGITAPQFNNGVLTATSIDTDSNNSCPAPYWENPYFNLLNDEYWKGPTDPPIDTGKYRYFTFRLKLEGEPDVSYGWISRIIWADFEFTNCGETDDIVLHEGWNEITIDLWADIIEPHGAGCTTPWQAKPLRYQLRLDPLEVPVATTFHVDEIQLTAMNTAASGSVYDIRYELAYDEVSFASDDDTPLTFYYDTDTDPTNGRTAAREYSSSTPDPGVGSNYTYLPFVTKAGTSLIEGEKFVWDLTGVYPGTYYINAEIGSGENATNWYSEVPVVIY